MARIILWLKPGAESGTSSAHSCQAEVRYRLALHGRTALWSLEKNHPVRKSFELGCAATAALDFTVLLYSSSPTVLKLSLVLVEVLCLPQLSSTFKEENVK